MSVAVLDQFPGDINGRLRGVPVADQPGEGGNFPAQQHRIHHKSIAAAVPAYHIAVDAGVGLYALQVGGAYAL